jgi:hypothetical protein
MDVDGRLVELSIDALINAHGNIRGGLSPIFYYDPFLGIDMPEDSRL